MATSWCAFHLPQQWQLLCDTSTYSLVVSGMEVASLSFYMLSHPAYCKHYVVHRAKFAAVVCVVFTQKYVLQLSCAA